MQLAKHISTADYISALAFNTPRNSYGLPEGLYRADLLPALPTERNVDEALLPATTAVTLSPDGSVDATPNLPITYSEGGKYANVAKLVGLPRSALDRFEEDLSAALIAIDYTEGFPTISNRPIWTQLNYEPGDAYMNFEAYLRQTELRKLKPETQQDLDDLSPSVRQLHLLETENDTSLEDLREQYITYYWGDRAKSYDLFNLVMRRRERERQALSVESQHFMMGNRLMTLCEAFLDANCEELAETLTPKNFIELIKTAAQLQRVSVGLPANGPSGTSNTHPLDENSTKSVEVIMRTIAKANALPADASSDAQVDFEAQNNALRSLLNDPAALSLAQELIVRINK